MSFAESVKIAVSAIWANKMRSLLTMLGIIIGISSVIAVVSLGKGSATSFNKEFEKFGIDRAYLTYAYEQEPTKNEMMTKDDIDAIKRKFAKEIKAMSVLYQAGGSVTDLTKKSKRTTVSLYGVDSNYMGIETIKLLKGRFFSDGERNSYQQVGVIDDGFAAALFGKASAIGKMVTINVGSSSVSFRVVGVFEAPKSDLGSAFGVSPPKIVYTPYTTVEKITNSDGTVNAVDFRVHDKDKILDLAEKIKDFLKERRNTQNDVYQVFTAQKQMESVNNFLGILTSVIGAIAAISLLVGGIGVMNIMLVSVTERTREIGIRKALGARRQDILVQFLIESIIISGIGGVIGTALGIGLAFLASVVVKIAPTIDPAVIAVAWVFSAGVGVFFGIYPANKAAKMDPIEALRYE